MCLEIDKDNGLLESLSERITQKVHFQNLLALQSFSYRPPNSFHEE